YVNADYCDTKSCKELSDVILKMGDTSAACKSFSAHVCKAGTDYSMKTLEKIYNDAGKFQAADTWKGVGLNKNVMNYLAASVDPQDNVDLQVPGDEGNDESPGTLDYHGIYPPAALAGGMAIRGIDGLIRAVHVIGNKSGDLDMGSMLELGAPIEDMFPYIILDMANIDLKGAVLLMQSDDDGHLAKLADFITSFNQLVISKTSTSRQHIARFITVSLLKSNHSTNGWDWETFFQPFIDIGVDYVTDESIVRLAHPEYIFALNKFFDDWAAK
ncbi:hypothetical protein MTO96_034008, partial [Rhipicephalus appendiculatus]